MSSWSCVLELDSQRRVAAGNTDALRSAIRGGADMRIGTAFRHNEHIDLNSANNELIREVMDFRVTYVLEGRWVAGIENLRMPISLPEGFLPHASMSFFLYNENGRQAIARPYLDGRTATGELGPQPPAPHVEMPKYHELERWDTDTNAPSSNFIYDFEFFRYFVRESWEEVLMHNAEGGVESGSIDALVEAFRDGCEIKVAVNGLCDDLLTDEATYVDHEVFVHVGAGYYYTEKKLFMASTNPVVRTRPAIPLGYGSASWDFGWLMPRTDGQMARWLCNPYTLEFKQSTKRHGMRWFVSR